MTSIKACLKIICFPPCTLDFACACWRRGGERTKWERLVAFVVIPLSQVDNAYWNKSDIIQNAQIVQVSRIALLLSIPTLASLETGRKKLQPLT